MTRLGNRAVFSMTQDAQDGSPFPSLAVGDPREDKALARAARDEPALFGTLYERHVATIYRYVYYRVGNHDDTEDLTARVFMRALKHIGSYDDRGVPFTAWLYRIAHNVVANFHRDNGRHPLVSLDDIEPRETHHHDDADTRIDERARMIMRDGSRAANMFAAGEIMAGNVLGKGYLAGIGMTIGSVFGRIAGEGAARHAAN